MKRSDEKRLADLRAKNELAELEILTLTADEVVENVDPENLTISQMIVVGELVNVLTILGDFKRRQTADRLRSILGSVRPTAPSVERRSGGPVYGPVYASDAPNFAGFLAGADTVPPQDYAADNDSDQDDGDVGPSDAELQAALASLMQKLTTASSQGPDDNDIVDTVQGPMRYGDLPKDESGKVTSEFADANCPCPTHTAKRNDPEDYYPTLSDGDDSAGVRNDLPYGQYV